MRKDMKVIVVLGITLLWVLACTGAHYKAPGVTTLSGATKRYCSTRSPGHCKLQDYQTWYRRGRHCIKYFNTPLNFSDAEFSCQHSAPGGHLVSLHSDQANSDVLCLVLKNSPSESRIWIGGMELLKSNKFVWTDGSSWNYENWVPGQPDNTSSEEDCVEMNWKITGHWNDDRCHVQKSYVCAFKA